jgi:hypothetical protein
MIEIDAAARRVGRRVVVYLGDYVDRGPDSQGVIEHLALSGCAASKPCISSAITSG